MKLLQKLSDVFHNVTHQRKAQIILPDGRDPIVNVKRQGCLYYVDLPEQGRIILQKGGRVSNDKAVGWFKVKGWTDKEFGDSNEVK